MATVSPRRRYYNPMLDNRLQQEKMTAAMAEAINEDEYDPPKDGGELHEPDQDHPANLVSSLMENGRHSPALDIDIPMEVVPSSTPGHCHAFFPTVDLSWPQYIDLLRALATAGILEEKYVEHSLIREQTLLRTNGCRKISR